MFRLGVLVLMLGAVAIPAANAEEGPQRFVVQLPEQWRDASRFRLLLEGITLPGNVALKLRLTTRAEDGREVFLASAGIEAISRTRSQERRVKSLRLDVTRSLKRFLESRGNLTSVDVFVQPVDARNNPIRDLEWSVETVRLESKKQ